MIALVQGKLKPNELINFAKVNDVLKSSVISTSLDNINIKIDSIK